MGTSQVEINKEKYQIIRSLGRGGMGEVFLAHDVELKRDVAIKFIMLPPNDHDCHIRRFHREAKVLAQLSHPNLVRLFEFGTFEGKLCIVMELVSGLTLTSLINDYGAFTSSEVLQIAIELLAPIEYIHNQGFVHRDIKPGNVMVTDNGILKLMDFGLVFAEDYTKLSKTGERVGTAAYLPPEALLANFTVTKSVDTYQLGQLLFELLCGPSQSSRSSHWMDIISLKMSKSYPPRDWFPDNVSSKLRKVVEKSLHYYAEDRYKNCADFRIALIHSGQSIALNKPRFNLKVTNEIVSTNETKGDVLTDSRALYSECHSRVSKELDLSDEDHSNKNRNLFSLIFIFVLLLVVGFGLRQRTTNSSPWQESLDIQVGPQNMTVNWLTTAPRSFSYTVVDSATKSKVCGGSASTQSLKHIVKVGQLQPDNGYTLRIWDENENVEKTFQTSSVIVERGIFILRVDNKIFVDLKTNLTSQLSLLIFDRERELVKETKIKDGGGSHLLEDFFTQKGAPYFWKLKCGKRDLCSAEVLENRSTSVASANHQANIPIFSSSPICFRDKVVVGTAFGELKCYELNRKRPGKTLTKAESNGSLRLAWTFVPGEQSDAWQDRSLGALAKLDDDRLFFSYVTQSQQLRTVIVDVNSRTSEWNKRLDALKDGSSRWASPLNEKEHFSDAVGVFGEPHRYGGSYRSGSVYFSMTGWSKVGASFVWCKFDVTTKDVTVLGRMPLGLLQPKPSSRMAKSPGDIECLPCGPSFVSKTHLFTLVNLSSNSFKKKNRRSILLCCPLNNGAARSIIGSKASSSGQSIFFDETDAPFWILTGKSFSKLDKNGEIIETKAPQSLFPIKDATMLPMTVFKDENTLLSFKVLPSNLRSPTDMLGNSVGNVFLQSFDLDKKQNLVYNPGVFREQLPIESLEFVQVDKLQDRLLVFLRAGLFVLKKTGSNYFISKSLTIDLVDDWFVGWSMDKNEIAVGATHRGGLFIVPLALCDMNKDKGAGARRHLTN